MKKWLSVFACVIALMLAMPTLAFAGHGGGHHGWRSNGAVQGSVQSCPMSQQGNCGRGYVDVDNDGVCDNQGQCNRFVDADNDGICDYHHSGAYCSNYNFKATSDDVASAKSVDGVDSSNGGNNAGSAQRQSFSQHYRSGHGCRR